jgi:hypothetical protein
MIGADCLPSQRQIQDQVEMTKRMENDTEGKLNDREQG